MPARPFVKRARERARGIARERAIGNRGRRANRGGPKLKNPGRNNFRRNPPNISKAIENLKIKVSEFFPGVDLEKVYLVGDFRKRQESAWEELGRLYDALEVTKNPDNFGPVLLILFLKGFKYSYILSYYEKHFPNELEQNKKNISDHLIKLLFDNRLGDPRNILSLYKARGVPLKVFTENKRLRYIKEVFNIKDNDNIGLFALFYEAGYTPWELYLNRVIKKDEEFVRVLVSYFTLGSLSEIINYFYDNFFGNRLGENGERRAINFFRVFKQALENMEKKEMSQEKQNRLAMLLNEIRLLIQRLPEKIERT